MYFYSGSGVHIVLALEVWKPEKVRYSDHHALFLGTCGLYNFMS